MKNTVLLMSEVDKISFTLKNGKTVEISAEKWEDLNSTGLHALNINGFVYRRLDNENN